ncbi:hypothetical protein AAFH68_37750 [Flavobacterium sp. CGRL1]
MSYYYFVFLHFFLSCKDKVNDEKIVNNQKKDSLNIDVAEIKKNNTASEKFKLYRLPS